MVNKQDICKKNDSERLKGHFLRNESCKFKEKIYVFLVSVLQPLSEIDMSQTYPTNDSLTSWVPHTD